MARNQKIKSKLTDIFLNCQVLSLLILSCTIFLPNCYRNQQSEAFLRKFLFEEGGAYTLLGDKPITDMLVFTGSIKDIDLTGLSCESLNNLSFIEDSTLEEWQSCKQQLKNLHLKNFLFLEGKCPTDPTYSWVALVNISKTLEIIHSHQALFQKIFPKFELIDIMKQIANPESSFYQTLFSDHYLSGLLHGYGDENSCAFADERMRSKLKIDSKKINKPIDHTSFPLPTYAAIENDPTKLTYEKQRLEIKKAYEKGHILKTTFALLEGR